jgi:hypothetical protein
MPELTLPELWYYNRVLKIRSKYLGLPRHNVSKKKTWKQVYNEYINDMKKDPSLKADVIKEQNEEKNALEQQKKGLLKEK